MSTGTLSFLQSPRFPRLVAGLGLAFALAAGPVSSPLRAQAGPAPAQSTPTQKAPSPVQSNERAPSHPSGLPDPPKPKRTTRHTTRFESQEEAQKYIRERRASKGRTSKSAPRSIKPPPHSTPHPPAPHPSAPHPPAPHPGTPK